MYLLISHPHPEASSQNDERIENVSISSPSPLQSPSPISHYAKLCSSSTNKLLGIIKGKSRLKHGMGWGWEKPRAGQRNAIASGLSPFSVLAIQKVPLPPLVPSSPALLAVCPPWATQIDIPAILDNPILLSRRHGTPRARLVLSVGGRQPRGPPQNNTLMRGAADLSSLHRLKKTNPVLVCVKTDTSSFGLSAAAGHSPPWLNPLVNTTIP